MALLQGLAQKAANGALWELTQLAQEAGLPLPPPAIIPALITGIGTGNPAALLDVLGDEVATALGLQIASPLIKNLVRGNLEGAKDTLLSYVGNLTTLESGLLDDLAKATGTTALLAQGRDLAGGVLGVLNTAQTNPLDLVRNGLPGPLMGLIRSASPELAGVLDMVQDTAKDAQGRLDSALNLVGNIQGRLESLTTLRGVADLAIDALDGRLDSLDDLFADVVGVLT